MITMITVQKATRNWERIISRLKYHQTEIQVQSIIHFENFIYLLLPFIFLSSSFVIYFIFSGGSDKYSVVADNNNKHDEQADSADTDSYAIIDMTDPIPICVNYPVGPDINKDLPGTANKSSKKVVRSSSFLTQNTGFIAKYACYN